MNKLQIATMVIVPSLCLTGLGWLGYNNWQLQQEIAGLKASSPAMPPFPSVSNPAPGGSIPPGGAPGAQAPQADDPFDDFFSGGDPFAEIQRMQQSMEKQMQQLMQQGGDQTFTFQSGQPDIDMEESKDAYVVAITIPEGSDIELNTEVNDDQLVVSGKVSNKVDAGGANIVSSSQFSRSFPLTSPVDSLGLTSETKDDKMVITLPKVG